MTPVLLSPDSAEIPQVLALIRSAFAYMDGRIDPPSSMHRLSEASLRDSARTSELWVLGDPVTACVLLSPRDECLYLGKLAVAECSRGRGLARRLVEHATARAQALGLPVLELQTRVELTENHAAFARMGFVRTGTTSHSGYDRPTSVTMRMPVP